MKLFSFLLVSLILLFLACLYEDPVAPEGEDGNSDSCSYTVTYDDQGATTPVNPSIQAAVPPAMTVDSLPTPPSKMCYVFSGWYTQPNGSGMQFNASTAVTTDITVYAHWIHYDYIVTFNDQGAITPTYPTTIMIYCPRTTVGQLPTPPSKIGWVFGGWWTKPNGGGTEFTASTVVTTSITVYAKWIEE
jgi:uncharacterized repeat protein (TIGR02543 family)